MSKLNLKDVKIEMPKYFNGKPCDVDIVHNEEVFTHGTACTFDRCDLSAVRKYNVSRILLFRFCINK